MEQFKDAHYFHVPSQGNVYTTAQLPLANGKLQILAASLKREIFALEYLEAPLGLVPSTKEIPFTYIPSGSEIISLDAFNKSTCTNEVVIGITIIKNSNDSDSLETFLNIYSQLEENQEFDIENVAQNCLTLELNFIPYKLMHTKLLEETVFVLSGSDNSVHVFRENPRDHVFKEIEEICLPEFGKTPSPVVWIDILHLNDERITAFSCECGYVKVVITDTRTNERRYSFATRFANHVPKVQLFRDKNRLNLIVVNATLPSALFRNISKYGLSDYVTLHRLDDGTVFTTCLVADIDFDSQKEIILGTSSGELFMYKYAVKEAKWYLEEVKFMAAPILALNYGDLSGDGVKELVVSSMIGIHVLQHDPVFIQDKLKDRADSRAGLNSN